MREKCLINEHFGRKLCLTFVTKEVCQARLRWLKRRKLCTKKKECQPYEKNLLKQNYFASETFQKI